MDASFAARLPALIDRLATDGWFVCPDFLDATTVAALQAEGRQRLEAGEFHRASVGRATGASIRDQIRGDSVLWLDPAQATSPEQVYWQQIELLRQTINRELYLGVADGEYHYAHYPVGTFYKRHLDRFRDDDARVVSCVCYLNQAWQETEGGQLRMQLDDGREVDIAPQGGNLVCFLSDRFPHEVLPATRERWSITGWMRRRTG
ncbi:2OG-Fe(II) oxygenase [Chitinimonas lacunae]|uniref:2OG-Fe(II) oxygenase n=1 Tax=Chitinimonas lacunae TaxID=1963018 RepID=A0ABV8MRI6_9NEIS